MKKRGFILCFFLLSASAWAQDVYHNPILYADYSDPDVIRVGSDYYLAASSFNCTPGLPILHSKDLVNWTLIGHALPRLPQTDVYARPQHGDGVWAPSIRYHDGWFYIYYPDPDYGIYMVRSKTPASGWSAPVLVLSGKGRIDPCPLWDEDGKVYLVYAWAGSRAGVNSLLTICRLNAAGDKALDEGKMVYDGHDRNPTIEGPKLYKRNGYYYIFAPAGGVTGGWQLALRSRDIYGPYEERVVLAQGHTPVNGPHQGAWVETPAGQDWFFHFQDRGPYGRILHLEPMRWVRDWPVIGSDGEPVATWRKPDVGRTYPAATQATSDEFDTDTLGLQWQWHANPMLQWSALIRGSHFLRLFAMKAPGANLWDVPNLLLQKFPGPDFTVTTKVRLTGDKVGLLIMGGDYSYLMLEKQAQGFQVAQMVCMGAEAGNKEAQAGEGVAADSVAYLRVQVRLTSAVGGPAAAEAGPVSAEGGAVNAECRFSYSPDGKSFTPVGQPFFARPDKWIGAKVGLFCVGTNRGYADIDWFRFDKL